MKKVVVFVLLTIFIGIQQNVYAKNKVKKIKLENISGEAIGGEAESLLEVKQRAVNNAKINALKEAGISENIKTYTDYFQSETDEEYEELFASNIFTNIQGSVTEVEITNTRRSFTEDGMLKVEVIINCTVLKYLTEDDLTFNYWVDGIKPNYNHNDLLEFSFKPASDGFLKAFIFTKTEAYQLFPNSLEKSRLLVKDNEYKFPLGRVNYRLETAKRSEMHRIVYVFMKEDIPYTHSVNYKQIFDWIFSIPPDQREIKSFSFTVFNQEAAE